MSEGMPHVGVRTRTVRFRRRCRPVLAVALAVQLMMGVLVLGAGRADVPASSELRADTTGADTSPRVATEFPNQQPDADTGSVSFPGPVPAPARDPAAGAAPSSAVDADPAPPAVADPDRLMVLEPGPPPPSDPLLPDATAPAPATTFPASAPGSDSERTFAREYPHHAAARQRDDVPSSFHWAVIIGVNDYMGRTTSTIGSVGDAHTLRDTLYREGWRGDQVLTLTDHAATHDRVVRAIEWLMRSTDHRSTVVFSFSGHMRHNAGVTALWPADNRFIWADDLGRMLGAVRADRMWAALQGCHAAGLAAPGLEGENRLVSYASRVEEKAYEVPASRHSVMGHYLLAGGLRDGQGDQHAGNKDGRVSVQEAFAWAAPRATSRTQGQSHGAQRPVLADGLGGREFPIAVTGPPATTRAPDEAGQRTSPRRRSFELPGGLVTVK